MNFTEKQIKDLIKRRHPRYDELLPHWEFLEATYNGGREWFGGNIFKYHKEGKSEYEERVKRAYRFNHTRELVDLVDKYIFKAPIQRNTQDAPEEIQRFWKNSTRQNEPFEKFSRRLSKSSSTLGRIYIVVDNLATETPLSKAEEKALNAKVYAYIVTPKHVLDMSRDENGDFNWILIRESFRDDLDPIASSGKVYPRYRLWTRNEWFLFEEKKIANTVKVRLVDYGEHNLGVVPVIAHDHTESDCDYSAPALIGDIAYLDRAVANYLSNLDAIIQDQTFSQLAMPAQGVVAGTPAESQVLEMGTKRVFLYDGEGGGKPEYLSPDPKQAELIITTIKQIVNEIYHSVGMAGERTKQDNALGIDNSSGVAKAYDFEKVNALLASKAAGLKLTESKILELVMLWNGKTMHSTELAELITYPETFDVRGLMDEFEIASQLTLIYAPDEVRRQQMRDLIGKLFPTLNRAAKDKMLAELNRDWPPKEPPLTVPGQRPVGESFQGAVS
jgi:hypothetical protein